MKTQNTSIEAVRARFLLKRASEVLGGQVTAKKWIDSENLSLGNKKPADMICDATSFKQVLSVLGRIEHGICL